jgi:hypothetical protein
MRIRRVVTGHDANGRAVFAADELVDGYQPAILPGAEFHRLWGGDALPRFPDDGSASPAGAYFPPVGGFRFGTFTLPPEGSAELPADLDVAAGLADMEAHLPGLMHHMEPGDPGMHTTATIDFEVVLHGEVVLELDDGAEVTLHQGDTVVQNGTRHRWHNRAPMPATLAVFIVGAYHARVTPPPE